MDATCPAASMGKLARGNSCALAVSALSFCQSANAIFHFFHSTATRDAQYQPANVGAELASSTVPLLAANGPVKCASSVIGGFGPFGTTAFGTTAYCVRR